MSTEANKEVSRRFDEVVMNGRNLEALDEFVAQDVVDHNVPPGFPPGIEGKRQVLRMFFAAFPDLHVETLGEPVAEGDMVAARVVIEGTHQGSLFGIAPTGKRVRVSGMGMARFADGKQVEHWLEMDRLSLMQQLGAIPTP